MKKVIIKIPRRVKVGEKVRFKEDLPKRMENLAGKEFVVKRLCPGNYLEIWKRTWLGLGQRICIVIPNGIQVVELQGSEITEDHCYITTQMVLPSEERILGLVYEEVNQTMLLGKVKKVFTESL